VRVTDQVTAPEGPHLNVSSDSGFHSAGTIFYVHSFNAGTVLYSPDRNGVQVTRLSGLPDAPSGIGPGYGDAVGDPANPDVIYAMSVSTTTREL